MSILQVGAVTPRPGTAPGGLRGGQSLWNCPGETVPLTARGETSRWVLRLMFYSEGVSGSQVSADVSVCPQVPLIHVYRQFCETRVATLPDSCLLLHGLIINYYWLLLINYYWLLVINY